MDFGVVLQTNPPASDVVRLMVDAERRGFSYGCTFDSVVLGQQPANLAVLGESMHVIRELAEGREVTLHGAPVRIPWVRDGKLEIWMAAYGPKALQLVGEQADG